MRGKRLPSLLVLLALLALTVLPLRGQAAVDHGATLAAESWELYALLEDSLDRLAAGETTLTAHRDTKEGLTQALRGASLAFFRDHPELFWLNGGYTCSYQGNETKGYEVTVSLQVHEDWAQGGGRSREEDAARVESVADWLARQAVQAGESRYDRLLFLHDWLTAHNLYNRDCAGGREAAGTAVPWTALAALDDSLSPVCEGYCAAFRLVCARLEVPCLTVTGGGHGWNYVQMEDGCWYAVDVTYDDPIYSLNGQEQPYLVSGGEHRRYFLRGSGSFFRDHTPEEELSLPALSALDYPRPGTFDDVEEDDWFAAAVATVTDRGLMVGMGDRRFSPQTTLTAAEAVTLACRLHMDYAGERRTLSGGSRWYDPYWDYAGEQGLTLPQAGPEEVCTREDFVALLASAVPQDALEERHRGDPFSADVFSTREARQAAARFYKAGIVNGLAGNRGAVTFLPQGQLTRGECAAILARLADPDSRV